MINYSFNVFTWIRKIIPEFLQRDAAGSEWVDPDGNSWEDPDGNSWFVESLAGNKHMSWVSALVSPLQTMNAWLWEFVQATRYKMYLTGQVIYLEHYLNDLFDPDLRRIFISNSVPATAPFVFNKVENNPVYIYNKAEAEDPFYLRNIADYLSQYDFIINVPSDITLTTAFTNQIRSAVNYYKQAGKKYTIINF